VTVAGLITIALATAVPIDGLMLARRMMQAETMWGQIGECALGLAIAAGVVAALRIRAAHGAALSASVGPEITLRRTRSY
jgi:hypothetical protein